ncbi:MAG: peptidoglycan DD-metalloendopeptidase family protein [Marmoricola sp.]
MARNLPRTPRTRRQVRLPAAVLATAALVAGPVLSGAQADDLHDKKNHAQGQVKAAQADLEDSSKALSAAYTRLHSAEAKLATAQKTLAETQGQLTAARVLDAQMQAKLVAAEAALEKAQVDLATGIANVKKQRSDIGRLAASNYQYGDPRLLGLSAVLNAQDFSDLTTQMNTVDNLMDTEKSMLDRLKAAKALLIVQRTKVAQYRGVVAEQRQAAAVNLERKKALEKQAAAFSAQVATLVTQRHGAAAWAQEMRAHDARKLAASKKEEARIKRLILARARKQHGGYQGASNGFLYRPVPGYVTSPFGWRRHPIYGYWGLHDGVDFHAPCGTPERAGAAGTVIDEYYSDVWGNRLYLDVGKVNGKAMTLIYNHISSYKAHTGDHVGRGDTVAYAGTTGWSTACHLHFTVMLNGTAVDPMKYL